MEVHIWIESFIRAFMFLLGIVGNQWLIISSLPGRISLLRTTEALVINLAVSNLITNYLEDLPETMAHFANRWFMGSTYCGAFMFFSDLSESNAIFSTLFISMFWYQKLVVSLTRGTAPVPMDNLRLVVALVVGSWILNTVFSCPHLIFASTEIRNDSRSICIEIFPTLAAKEAYNIMFLIFANFLPICGIIYTTIRIVITLRRHQKRIQGMTSNRRPAAGKDEKSTPTVSSGVRDAKPAGRGAETSVSAVPGCSSMAGSSNNSVAGHPAPASCHADTREVPPPRPTSRTSNQVRAAKSVVIVSSVFLICWVTHLLLRISNQVNESPLLLEVASYIAKSYTSIIPYVLLHGFNKLSCTCKR